MVVTNANVVLPEGVKRVDVRIEEGRIAEIGEDLRGERFDAKGRYLLPAMIDIGVGVRDGRLRGGTLERLADKAGRNGFGMVALTALCTPRVDNEITLEFVKSQAERSDAARIETLVAGVKGEGGLADCAILVKEGGVGIEFESALDGNRIRRLMEYARLLEVPLFCRANDPALQGDGVMQEGEVAARLGLAGVPELAESSQVARVGEFAEEYGVDVVVLHASTPRTLEICRDNPRLTAQVPLPHLLLDESACDDYDTSGKIWPPLRSAESRDAMVQMVRKGEVPMLTSLHSPVSETAKDAVFAEAAYGIDGMEGFLPLLYRRFVAEERLGWSDVVRLTSENAAKILGLSDRKGRIAVGYDADLILFDPQAAANEPDARSPYRRCGLQGSVEKLATIAATQR